MPETKETKKPESNTCDLCGDNIKQDGQIFQALCICRERFGRLLINAHREYQEAEKLTRAGKPADDLLPLTIVTRAGQRLHVDGGIELCAGGIGMVLLREVSTVSADEPIIFDQVEIRYDEIAWVGFNLP